MVEIDIAYEGDLQCRATHGPSHTTMRTDAPVDNNGKGRTFSPTDLVATALGTCILTILGILARRHEIDLGGGSVKVVKEMSKTSPRRIARLETTVRIPLDLPEEMRARLENAAHQCPVHKSLHPDVEAPITFVWGA
jgi:putative redox protein